MKTFFNGAKQLLTGYPGGTAEVLPGVPEDVTERPAASPTTFTAELSEAMRRSSSAFLREQHAEGYWWYELESNVTIVSEYLMLLHFLGIHEGQRDRKIANHIIRNQRPDGAWALYYGGESDLSTTIEAYFALKLAGLSRDARLEPARDFVLAHGGVEASRVFTKIYLALFGQFPWQSIPAIPVELNLFPAWFPLNIYNFSSWARSTVVPLSLILEHKPVRLAPEACSIRELFRYPDRVPPITADRLSPFSWKRIFILLDRFMKAVDDLPVRPLRPKAMVWTEQWILDHQEQSGDWGGIQPAMVNSLLALTAAGHPIDSEPVRKGLEALSRFTRETGDELALQSCISPVWDTALASLALLAAGADKNHPSLTRACAWLASKQIFRKGDWSVKRPALEPGGWAFEFENSWYPDVDDTAVVLLLLKQYADREDIVTRENLSRGLHWVMGMQGKDGGWGAFDVDNDLRMLNQLLFGDLEAMIDPSTPDLTGRVLELLGAFGYGQGNDVVRRAVAFIRANQEPEGSWWGRWGVNHLYGTCTVLCGLEAAGEDMSRAYVRKAVEWIQCMQNPDGGWGEHCGSYWQSPSNTCAARSTPSQTAWALLALLAAGEVFSNAARDGARFLLARQNEDGTWDEPEFTGTGFPKYFYLRYDNYRNCFPLMALGRYFARYTGRGNGT